MTLKREDIPDSLFNIGLLLLGALVPIVFNHLWSQSGKATIELQTQHTRIEIMARDITDIKRQTSELATTLSLITTSNQEREARTLKLEWTVNQLDKSIETTSALTTRQYNQLQTQLADIQRTILPQPKAP